MNNSLSNHMDDIRAALNVVPSNKHLYLFHNSAGIILEFINPVHDNLAEVHSILKDSGSLAPFFELEALGIAEKLTALPQRMESNRPLPFLGFYTLMPQYSMVSKKIGLDCYLGRFAGIDFHPQVDNQTFQMPLFVDTRTDTLAGFSTAFHWFFKKAYPNPVKMLGLPVSTFLSPSPAQFNRSSLPAFDPNAHPDFETLLEGPIKESWFTNTADAGKLRVEKDAVKWDGNDSPAMLTLRQTVKPLTQDFVLTLELEGASGHGPCVLLGLPFEHNGPAPDSEGYLAGPLDDAENKGSGWWMIKRNGFKVAAQGAPVFSSAITRIRFCKIGRTLMWYENDALKVMFYDPEPRCPENAHLTLYLRPGDTCVIKAMSLKSRPMDKKTEWKRQMAKLTDNSNRFFAVDAFSNIALSQAIYYAYQGYFLSDVTEMQSRIRDLSNRYKTLLSRLGPVSQTFIGESRAIISLKESARLAAGSDATVLLEGPTGSGKEVLARYIHEQSNRKERPFVKVDCATIPASLIESRLFGHEKGAFTGAVARQIGFFESAEAGTLFLDEIGNLTPEVQSKLLQFLNDRTLTRVGGVKPLRLNVRLIAASNVNLGSLVRDGRFREDLFFRLNVIYLYMPSLSARREDILPLCRHFLARFATEQGKGVSSFTPEAENRLLNYGWPGNIRELSNIIQRAVIFAPGGEIEIADLDFAGQKRGNQASGAQRRTPFRANLTSGTRVIKALRKFMGRAEDAARELGMARPTLYKYLKQKGIKPSDYRQGFSRTKR